MSLKNPYKKGEMFEGASHLIFEKVINKARQKELETLGYTVIRFTNQEVMESVEEVVKKISEKILQSDNLHKNKTLQIAESKSPL